MRDASSAAVLFVGARPGALAACHRLGIRAAVLHDEPLRRDWRPLFEHGAVARDLRDAAELLELVDGFDGFVPTCVLALTERAVVAAARLRTHFGLAGSDAVIAERCHDKAIMKSTLARAAVPVTDWVEVDAHTDAAELIARLGLPLVLKPRSSSGSRGLVFAHDLATVRRSLQQGQLAERFIFGTEFSIETIRADSRTCFVNCTAYHDPMWANIVPHELDASARAAAITLNERALDALGVTRGIAHTEMFATANGLVIGEVAMRPPGGYLMRLLQLAYGFDAWEALIRIVALDERPALPQHARAFAGVRIFHPGAGTVRNVHGAAEIEAWPETVELSVRVRPGSRVDPRLGVGQEAAHVIVRGTDRDTVARRLDDARDVLRFELDADG